MIARVTSFHMEAKFAVADQSHSNDEGSLRQQYFAQLGFAVVDNHDHYGVMSQYDHNHI